MIRARVMDIVQYENNPRTGEGLGFSKDVIEEALIKHKSIKKYAFICHDKDSYTEEDEANCVKQLQSEYEKVTSGEFDDTPITLEEYIEKIKWVHSGDLKPRHWHIVISLEDARDVSDIANWFHVPVQYVEVLKGRGALLDYVRYLTHEDPKQVEAGKHRYDDSEVFANFDFRKALNDRSVAEAPKKSKQALRISVLHGELTLREVKQLYPESYVNDFTALAKMRLEYLQCTDPPSIRMNIYICGRGGIGKGVASLLLARRLYPEIANDSELVFRVGADGAGFEGYDGQKVIIWDDCRSIDIFKKLGSRGNIFNVFDTSPHRQRQNVKYGSVNLVNSVNIINSVEPYQEFLDGLVGEYTDRFGNEYKAENDEKDQSYRRFPIILPLRVDDFDILISKAYLDGEGLYSDYYKFENIRGNFGRLARTFPLDSITVVNLSHKMLRPVIAARDRVLELEAQKVASEEDLPEEFSNYGNFSVASSIGPENEVSEFVAELLPREDKDDEPVLSF